MFERIKIRFSGPRLFVILSAPARWWMDLAGRLTGTHTAQFFGSAEAMQTVVGMPQKMNVMGSLLRSTTAIMNMLEHEGQAQEDGSVLIPAPIVEKWKEAKAMTVMIGVAAGIFEDPTNTPDDSKEG